jgi:ribosomal protein L23
MFMRLISWKPNKAPPQALLHVPPAMTKHEITEYLTKIYDVDVTKVMTANFLGEFSYSSSAVALSDGLWPLFTLLPGKWKRFYGKRKILSYKRRNYKTALVYYDKGAETK